jgi:hypothetical protein
MMAWRYEDELSEPVSLLQPRNHHPGAVKDDHSEYDEHAEQRIRPWAHAHPLQDKLVAELSKLQERVHAQSNAQSSG